MPRTLDTGMTGGCPAGGAHWVVPDLALLDFRLGSAIVFDFYGRGWKLTLISVLKQSRIPYVVKEVGHCGCDVTINGSLATCCTLPARSAIVCYCNIVKFTQI